MLALLTLAAVDRSQTAGYLPLIMIYPRGVRVNIDTGDMTARNETRGVAGRIELALAVGLAALMLTACADGRDGAPQGGGEPRAIRVEALDSLAFEPDGVSVEAGERVRFVVTNTGTVDHEFVLGPESVQMAHEEASGRGEEHGGMHVEGQLAALELAPGETAEAS
jgi:plastocyanin